MSESKELNFTDNELKSIAVNAMDKSSEAGTKAVMRIGLAVKSFIKVLIPLLFCAVYSNAYAPHNPTECSLSLYTGKKTKCVKLVYDEVNERLDRTYKNIINNIPRADTIEIIQEYTSRLKAKNEICGKNPKNEIKASCEDGFIYNSKDETELDCRSAKSDFCSTYEYYGSILKNIPEYNTTRFTKDYNSWLKSKDEFCKKYSNDEIKLKSCHIDYSIPKLNEFWGIESVLLEYPFEGKWASCSYNRGNLTCGTYFFVEQGDNVCSGDWYRTNPDERYFSISLQGKEGNRLYPVKDCFIRDADGRYLSTCDIIEDGYDEQGRKTYRTSVPFLEWEDDEEDSGRYQQDFRKEPRFYAYIKTPFLAGEKEELIQTNKWLKDCLNYKGKQYE
jgi:uncharacterized protein YecT (DUF1311 family)